MRVALAVAVGLALASDGRAATFTLHSDEQALPIEIMLDIAVTAPALDDPALTPLRLTEAGPSLAGDAAGPGWTAHVQLTPSGAGVALVTTIRHTATVMVDHEVVHLRLPGPGQTVDRSLTLTALTGPRRVDAGTPVLLLTPTLGVVATDGAVAARYTPQRDGTIDVALILDDRAAHPFSVYTQCLNALPKHPAFGALEHRRPLDQLTRQPNDTIELHALLYPLRPGAARAPLIVERWPDGAKAAVVFTDHADRTDPAALRAVLWGSSKPADPLRPRGGFFGHGLALTKTFFAGPGIGGLQTDAAARELAQTLIANGSEVGSHSPTPHTDLRAVVQNSLATFAPYHSVTWIDHEPYTNCEAVAVRGWDATSDVGVVDLLAAAGYRWVWAATDAHDLAGSAVTNLFGGDPATAAPVIYPLPPEPRLWVFRSIWFYLPPHAFAAALSARALDALEQARGLFVAHTYLSPSAATTRQPEHIANLYVRAQPDGSLALDPGVDLALARLAERARAGTTRTLTWRDVGDRLLALGTVTVAYDVDGGARVQNRGREAIDGCTLSVPLANVTLTIDGAAIAGSRQEPDRSTIWFSLPAGGSVTVRAARDGTPLPLLPMVRATLTP